MHLIYHLLESLQIIRQQQKVIVKLVNLELILLQELLHLFL